jgi:hypothetical protein
VKSVAQTLGVAPQLLRTRLFGAGMRDRYGDQRNEARLFLEQFSSTEAARHGPSPLLHVHVRDRDATLHVRRLDEREATHAQRADEVPEQPRSRWCSLHGVLRSVRQWGERDVRREPELFKLQAIADASDGHASRAKDLGPDRPDERIARSCCLRRAHVAGTNTQPCRLSALNLRGTLSRRCERVVQALMRNRISDANRGASWRRARCWFARDGDVIVRGVDLDGRTARFAHELLLDHHVTLAGVRRAT